MFPYQNVVFFNVTVITIRRTPLTLIASYINKVPLIQSGQLSWNGVRLGAGGSWFDFGLSSRAALLFRSA